MIYRFLGFFKKFERGEEMINVVDDEVCASNTKIHSCELVAFYRERVEYLESLVRKYKFDFLTGLMGKRDYTNRIDNLFEDYKFTNAEFFFALIDINDLHNVNRKNGYHEGDNLIKSVATKLETFFQFHNIFRIGGDEFAILIRGHSTTVDEIFKNLETIESITFVVESSKGMIAQNICIKYLMEN